MFVLAVSAAHRLGSHRGQHIITGGQADEERKWNQPDAEAKVRGDHGEARVIDSFVVRGALVGSSLGSREMSKPDIVI